MKLTTHIGILTLIFPHILLARGNLENPVLNSTESGIGLISGWHCTAKEISVFVDGIDLGKSGVGSVRNDTASICGHKYTGFSVLYNFNKPDPGQHTIEVYADGTLLERRGFNTVRSGGVPFAENINKTITVNDFPERNKNTELQWSQAKQTFSITKSTTLNTQSILDSLNQTISGNTYNIGPFSDDSSTYTFNLKNGSFYLERSAFFSGTCRFNGAYIVENSALQATGTYSCSDFTTGTFQAIDLRRTKEGLYVGKIKKTPSGSSDVYWEVHTGY